MALHSTATVNTYVRMCECDQNAFPFNLCQFCTTAFEDKFPPLQLFQKYSAQRVVVGRRCTTKTKKWTKLPPIASRGPTSILGIYHPPCSTRATMPSLTIAFILSHPNSLGKCHLRRSTRTLLQRRLISSDHTRKTPTSAAYS